MWSALTLAGMIDTADSRSSKEVYDFAPSKFMTVSPETHENAVNLRLRLITLTSRGMFEKSSCDRIVSI
jgi:hypothetical protein